MNTTQITMWILLLAAVAALVPARAATSSAADEEQLPHKMHTAMRDLPHIIVGRSDADIVGADNRALQAAVDYVAVLGGGVVEIGPGEYLMHDSLHLRSFVTVRGTPGKTILRKADGASSPLAVDGDFGEEQVTVKDPNGFMVGDGIAVWDAGAGGFHLTVARITGRRGSTFAMDHPLMSDCMVANSGMAAAVFPVVSGCEIEAARVEHLIVEGNREHNVHLDGCRGGGIYLYRSFGTVIERCTVRHYNGDGLSFQQSNDVTVSDCLSEQNASLGIHPGSGSQRATVRGCTSRNNGEDGLYLCWRVRHGRFEDNLLEGNGRFGISLGHKDTDNLLRHNQVRGNRQDGVCFRDESLAMASHRNVLEGNLIENNGVGQDAAGVHVEGETQDLVIRDNQIRDTRPVEQRRQVVGVRLDEKVGPLKLDRNDIEAPVPLKDARKSSEHVE